MRVHLRLVPKSRAPLPGPERRKSPVPERRSDRNLHPPRHRSYRRMRSSPGSQRRTGRSSIRTMPSRSIPRVGQWPERFRACGTGSEVILHHAQSPDRQARARLPEAPLFSHRASRPCLRVRGTFRRRSEDPGSGWLPGFPRRARKGVRERAECVARDPYGRSPRQQEPSPTRPHGRPQYAAGCGSTAHSCPPRKPSTSPAPGSPASDQGVFHVCRRHILATPVQARFGLPGVAGIGVLGGLRARNWQMVRSHDLETPRKREDSRADASPYHHADR